jgi:hypothetical protein
MHLDIKSRDENSFSIQRLPDCRRSGGAVAAPGGRQAAALVLPRGEVRGDGGEAAARAVADELRRWLGAFLRERVCGREDLLAGDAGTGHEDGLFADGSFLVT